jgi:DNA modification methylase
MIGRFIDNEYGLFNVYGILFKNVIVWHKTNPVPSFRKRNFLNSCEFVVVGSKGESKIPNFLYQKHMHNFFETSNSAHYGKTIHPTEKPVNLISWLIKVGSNKDDTILDSFMGSGTTAVACKQLSRRYIGFEISKEYCEVAERRLSEETNSGNWW